MSTETDPKITELLHGWWEGEEGAFEQLLPAVLEDLQHLARHYLAREGVGHTLQPTALVHEVYLRLMGHKIQDFSHRSEFFAFAARLMREILVDHARGRRAKKRGGDAEKVPLIEALDVPLDEALDRDTILVVDGAVSRLGKVHPRQRQVVELRYFMGLTVPEIALALEVGRATVERDWTTARRWLARELRRARRGRAGVEEDLTQT